MKLFHIHSVHELIGERFHELDQLIGRRYINEVRLFMSVHNFVVMDALPIELMDFQKKETDDELLCVKFKFRQFDFKNADCHPSLELWSQYLKVYGFKLIEFKELLQCQSVIKRFNRLIGAKDLEGDVFCSIHDTGIIDLDPKELVQDTDHFVISKM